MGNGSVMVPLSLIKAAQLRNITSISDKNDPETVGFGVIFYIIGSAPGTARTVRAVAPFHHWRRRREFSADGGVESRNDPAVMGKTAGSWQKFKEESQDDK